MARKKRETIDKNSRSYLEMQIRNARTVILTILLFTLANLVLLLIQSNTYFLFSASVPYYCTAFAMEMDGWKFGTYTILALVLSLVILGIYFLCWRKAEDSNWAFVIALVLFCVDSAILIALYVTGKSVGNFFDLLFHCMAIAELAVGISSAKKLEKLPPDQGIVGADGVLFSE